MIKSPTRRERRIVGREQMIRRPSSSNQMDLTSQTAGRSIMRLNFSRSTGVRFSWLPRRPTPAVNCVSGPSSNKNHDFFDLWLLNTRRAVSKNHVGLTEPTGLRMLLMHQHRPESSSAASAFEMNVLLPPRSRRRGGARHAPPLSIFNAGDNFFLLKKTLSERESRRPEPSGETAFFETRRRLRRVVP